MADYTLLGSPENILYSKKSAIKLLDFGRNFPSSEGGSYYLGGDGNPLKDRPRETWITARMLHVYSIGKMLRFRGCGELAEKGLNGLHTVGGKLYAFSDGYMITNYMYHQLYGEAYHRHQDH